MKTTSDFRLQANLEGRSREWLDRDPDTMTPDEHFHPDDPCRVPKFKHGLAWDLLSKSVKSRLVETVHDLCSAHASLYVSSLHVQRASYWKREKLRYA